MIRSLSFVYLFLILAVSYLGGALLFRELPGTTVEKVLKIFDARVVDGYEASFLWPALMTTLFFVAVYLLASIRQLRFTVLFWGAVKSVLFGLSAGYLLSSGMRMIEYTVWWFPFQFVTCFLFLTFCAVLSPPFFMRTTGRNKRNSKALVVLFVMTVVVTILEITVFYFLFM